MDTGLLPVERTALLPADRPAGSHLVLPLSGVRHERTAAADEGAGERSASVRIRALLFAITVDHGTEFTSKALDEWRYLRGVKLEFIRPGKPTENGTIESFNERLRNECLNVNDFVSLDDVKEILTAWRHDYNHCRPHGSLGNLTPSEYARK